MNQGVSVEEIALIGLEKDVQIVRLKGAIEQVAQENEALKKKVTELEGELEVFKGLKESEKE
jgi:uncharacterized pyridoxamine 5'-phosphate oxidase family protein